MKNITLKSLLNFRITRRLLYSIIKFKNSNKNRALLTESFRRKNISIFEYEDLAKHMSNGYFHPNGDIQFYGFYHVIMDYSKTKRLPLNIAQEHGFIFSSFVHKHFIYADTILTFSDYREKQIFNEYPLAKCLKIGPYIHYAKELLNTSEYNVIKKSIGRTLLVFPFHSIDGVFSDFDSDKFMEVIEQKRKGFDTVIVCLYFKDIQLGRAKSYVEKGFTVATAGHINDVFFLNRLKSIIQLSDSIVSNGLGSHIAYSMYLKKRVELFRQKTNFCDEEGFENNENRLAMVDIEKHWDEYDLLQDSIFRILNGNYLSKDDNEYLNNFFGFNHIKTAEELYRSLNN